jgi:peptidoglycan/xylan/chitin deacetylase (PgdA/CDA1 family)
MRGLRTLQTTGRWLRSRFSPGGIILLYHRVAVSSVDPFKLSVSPGHFRDQMATLRKWASPMALQELVSAAARGQLPLRAVAVTFDDGYLDTLETALPALEEHDVPATVFITTGNPGMPFWWDRISYQILTAPEQSRPIELEVEKRSYHWTMNGASARERGRILRQIHGLCCRLPLDSRDLVVHQVGKWSARDLPDAERALTRDEIRQLAASKVISIGSHTVNHPVLSLLSVEAQRSELERSRRDLELVVGKPVTTMSYPFGLPGTHYNRRTVQVAREAGYICACAACTDVVHPKSDPLQLPRYWINDWSGERLIRRLQRWIGK